jgi:Tfp pilus assembly major pilin PilA
MKYILMAIAVIGGLLIGLPLYAKYIKQKNSVPAADGNFRISKVILQ